MKTLFLALSLFITIGVFAQERTFLMNSKKNEIRVLVNEKWVVEKRTYANIEFEVIDGVITATDNGESKYTPISERVVTEQDGYSKYRVVCRDNKGRKCIVCLYKLPDETTLFMITIEFDFAKLFYFREIKD